MPRDRDRLVDISCTIVHETERAYCIDHGGTEDAWVPKSLCEWDERDLIMTMPEWLAKDKGLL